MNSAVERKMKRKAGGDYGGHPEALAAVTDQASFATFGRGLGLLENPRSQRR